MIVFNPFGMPDEVFRKLYRFPRELAHEFFLQLYPFLEHDIKITNIPNCLLKYNILFLNSLQNNTVNTYSKLKPYLF